MDDEENKIRQVAALSGYELAYSQLSWGENFFGLLIFVKMSNRKLDERDVRHTAAFCHRTSG